MQWDIAISKNTDNGNHFMKWLWGKLGFDSRQGQDFSRCHYIHTGPGTPALFPKDPVILSQGVKEQKCSTDHSPTFSARIYNTSFFISITPVCLCCVQLKHRGKFIIKHVIPTLNISLPFFFHEVQCANKTMNICGPIV